MRILFIRLDGYVHFSTSFQLHRLTFGVGHRVLNSDFAVKGVSSLNFDLGLFWDVVADSRNNLVNSSGESNVRVLL